MTINQSLLSKLNSYAMDSIKRMKQLQWGTGIFFIGVGIVYMASELEWQWLFYCGAAVMIFAAIFAFPAYLALIYWRLFRNTGSEKNKE